LPLGFGGGKEEGERLPGSLKGENRTGGRGDIVVGVTRPQKIEFLESSKGAEDEEVKTLP